MSAARVLSPRAERSGAAKPGVPPRRPAPLRVDDAPKSTTATRPPLVRMRFAGLMSPWKTGGSWL